MLYQACMAKVAILMFQRRPRRRTQYAPASYTASHVDQEKRNAWDS